MSDPSCSDHHRHPLLFILMGSTSLVFPMHSNTRHQQETHPDPRVRSPRQESSWDSTEAPRPSCACLVLGARLWRAKPLQGKDISCWLSKEWMFINSAPWTISLSMNYCMAQGILPPPICFLQRWGLSAQQAQPLPDNVLHMAYFIPYETFTACCKDSVAPYTSAPESISSTCSCTASILRRLTHGESRS